MSERNDLVIAVNDALEWRDFLIYCERNEVIIAEDDHVTWRSTFSNWREMRTRV